MKRKQHIDVTVTKLERTAEGHWQCRVTGPDGKTVPIHCKYGSWMHGDLDQDGGMHEVHPSAAAAASAKVRKIERAERRAAAEAEETPE